MPTEAVTAYRVQKQDVEFLRPLGQELARIAALPVQRQRADLWRRVNDLEPARPAIWINEVPWHEMNVNEELTLRCVEPWARQLEGHLRRTLYQWKHFPGDMIVSDYLACPLAIHNTGYGINEDVETIATDPASGVVSRHFHPQIVEPGDIEKIRMPVVTHDVAATEARFAAMQEVFGAILPVRRQGIQHIWYTPWDHLIRLWGVEQAMIDLVDRPDMVHAAVERCVQSSLAGLDQMVAQNLLSAGAGNTRVGSGGYGYTRSLPAAGFDPGQVRPVDNWGCSNAQIFSEVSPDMHWEFALKHDLPWLSRWGLNYYGCCEPLDLKIEILKRIPRLRKVSMSPWIRVERAVAAVGTQFVFSFKPNPAVLAEDTWRPDQAERDLRRVLERARGLHVEIILKDISTVRYQPQRLWAWAAMAGRVVEEYGGR